MIEEGSSYEIHSLNITYHWFILGIGNKDSDESLLHFTVPKILVSLEGPFYISLDLTLQMLNLWRRLEEPFISLLVN